MSGGMPRLRPVSMAVGEALARMRREEEFRSFRTVADHAGIKEAERRFIRKRTTAAAIAKAPRAVDRRPR